MKPGSFLWVWGRGRMRAGLLREPANRLGSGLRSAGLGLTVFIKSVLFHSIFCAAITLEIITSRFEYIERSVIVIKAFEAKRKVEINLLTFMN